MSTWRDTDADNPSPSAKGKLTEVDRVKLARAAASAPSKDTGLNVTQRADAAGISRSSMTRFDIITESGDAELVKQVMSGEKSIGTAWRELDVPPKPRGIPKGKGVQHAYEAVNCLKNIPDGDKLETCALDIVSRYIRSQRRRIKCLQENE